MKACASLHRHTFKNYDGVLKVDGEVGNKKVYDPRSYLALAEAAMAERVKENDIRVMKTVFPGQFSTGSKSEGPTVRVRLGP